MMTETKQRTCEERIVEHLVDRVGEITHALQEDWEWFGEGTEYEDIIDWVNANSLSLEDDPHYRAKDLCLSTGGPEDGFRFFEDGTIEYYYKDWWDNAVRVLHGQNKITLEQLRSALCFDFEE